MAKKKTRPEAREARPGGEAALADPPEQTVPAPDPEFIGPPPPAPAPAPEPAEALPADPILAPSSQLAPEAGPESPERPLPASEPPPDLVLSSLPVAQPAAPLALAVPDAIGPLEERIRRLEALLTGLQQMQGKEPRAGEQVITSLPPARAELPVPAGPSMLERATTLLEAGKHLLPGLAPPPGTGGTRPASGKAWFLWETLAEVRAIIRMYTDPRYRLSWFGRMAPLILLAAFATTYWWVPFATLGLVGWIPDRIASLLVAFVLFKVLAHEARRYRETAPDLPPSLRL